MFVAKMFCISTLHCKLGITNRLSSELENRCPDYLNITHVPQVIARTGKGLFYQSEEVVEATHSKFETFWKRYKVLDVQSEQHGQNLLECLLDFNTKNINIKVLTSH